MEYNFLVKKVVFKISTLPAVKVVSSLFVHAFFILFMLIMYACYGMFPDLYDLQILYYSLCMVFLTLGLVYATSAVSVFFRDLMQIVNIFLQVLIWMTPIMWNMDAVSMPGWVRVILKLNPMFYIVSGYRDALINKQWFWNHPILTLYFWGLAIAVWLLGTHIFRKLKPHFADVL